MQQNPTTCPTWDEFLRPLLELARLKPFKRRTAVVEIANTFNFSEEARTSRVKSGQLHMQNRGGWALSALKKANFVETDPSGKFMYRITSKGEDYLNQHDGPISDADLFALDGYKEAWEEASKKRQKQSSENQLPTDKVLSKTPDESIESAVSELDSDLRTSIIEYLLNINPYRFEQIVIDVLVAMGYGGSRDEAAQVTQKSNDGGIDGIINEDRLGLDVIYVQAKRHKNKIGRIDIQNFVGA